MIEHRAVTASVVWRDGKGSAESASIFGHAAVFNKETTIDLSVFAFRERIAPGAFTKNIRQDDVRALFNHDPNYVLGRNRNNTLTLAEDSIGLRYEARPPKTTAAQDVRQLLIGGYVTGSSFAFSDPEDEWDESEMKKGKLPLRTIRTFGKLIDVSPVTFPAYPSADSQARSNGVTTMREKATDVRGLPLGYKRVLQSMEKNLHCRRCGKHLGLGWRTRGSYALHEHCAESFDMQRERTDLQARVEARTPAAFTRLHAAAAQLAAADRRRV